MNFLDKLNYLMAKNNLNKNTLSKACDIPYTTIDGWYKKGYEGLKLTTLRKLSNYFGTTLDFWASDAPFELSNISDEIKQLIQQYSSLDDRDQKLIKYILKLLYDKTEPH